MGRMGKNGINGGFMSFIVSKNVRKCGYFPDLGIQEPSTEITIDLTYEITGMQSLCVPLGIATYRVSTEGCDVCGFGVFEFEWSGSGNPIDVAEEALKNIIC